MSGTHGEHVIMQYVYVLGIVGWLGCGGASDTKVKQPQPAKASELERVDVFGSSQLDRATVIARWGDRLVALVKALESPEEVDINPMKLSLEAQINAAGKFAAVEISMINYFDPPRAFVTVDLVDAKDRDRRMSFAPAPAGTHPDPDGLLALWQEYQQKAMQLLMSGAIKPQKEACPFWHCITFAHESLVPYRDAFAKRVPVVEQELATILRDAADEHHRAAAAFLLGHLASGDRVVSLMLPAIRDPSSDVRNNSMRVLALIAQDHPEIAIPLDPIIGALQFPTTTDRNKASAILDGITRASADTRLRNEVRERGGEVLVNMLELRQPNNHDYAYSILKQISGRDLGERSIDAWRAWVRAPDRATP